MLARDDGGTIIPFFNNFVYASRSNIGMPPTRLAASWECDGARAASRWWFDRPKIEAPACNRAGAVPEPAAMVTELNATPGRRALRKALKAAPPTKRNASGSRPPML